MGTADDEGDASGASIKSFVVWSLETGMQIITMKKVIFGKSKYSRTHVGSRMRVFIETRIKKLLTCYQHYEFRNRKDRSSFLRL